MGNFFQKTNTSIKKYVFSVPVRWKIIGIGIMPVIILGVSLNYWITTGLSNWLSYLLTDVRVNAAMQAGSRSVLFVTGIAAFLSIIVLALLVDILNTPIIALKKTAEDVAAGKFTSRATVWARDEIGDLAVSVNRMIDNFVDVQENLSYTNRQLAVINRISLAADQEDEIHDVLYISLESILSLDDFGFAWIYLYDPEVDKHHLASWKDVPDDLREHLITVDLGALCECQRALASQSLAAEIQIVECPHLQAAGYGGEKSKHITIPIVARDVQFGIINLVLSTTQPLSLDLKESLSSIGTKISEVVANAWLQIKIKEKEAARQLLLKSLVTAQENERSNLARELHDHAGQSLTSLLVRLKTLENRCDQDGLKEDLLGLETLVSKTIDQIRDLSYSLRPPALDEFGLGTAIASLADDIASQTGISIKFKNRLDIPTPRDLEIVLYRIVQEGLTNVVRHADATKVVIEVEPRERHIYLKLDDNGRGFVPADVVSKRGRQHLGLISMHERAELVGGKLALYSVPGKGTTIEVTIPFSTTELMYE